MCDLEGVRGVLVRGGGPSTGKLSRRIVEKFSVGESGQIAEEESGPEDEETDDEESWPEDEATAEEASKPSDAETAEVSKTPVLKSSRASSRPNPASLLPNRASSPRN